jgi:hypothetical protein
LADLSITAASVKLKSNVKPPIIVQVGESVAQGQPGYSKTTDAGKYWRADADTSGEAAAAGVFMTAAATNGYAMFAPPGCVIDLGATLVVGQIYVVSVNAGGSAPYSDLASGDFVTIVGIASAADSIELVMKATGVAKA